MKKIMAKIIKTRKKLKCQICDKTYVGYPNRRFCDVCKKARAKAWHAAWAREHYDKDKSREVHYRYLKKYPEKTSAYRKMWLKKNRIHCNLYKKKLRERDLKQNPCKIHLLQARNRCRARGTRYFREGIECVLTINEVKMLWNRDKAGLLYYPSLDRKDSKKDYTYENCRFIECYENCNRNKPPTSGFWSEHKKMKEIKV